MICYCFRKRKSKDSEQRELPPSNDSADYCNVKTRTDNDYYVLQQSNPINQSADYSQLKFKSTNTNNVDSDLPVHNCRQRKAFERNIS